MTMDCAMDLSFLSEEEYFLILEVLNRCDAVQKRENTRVKRLKSKVNKTDNPVILKKIMMRSNDWFWERSEKVGSASRDETAATSLRLSLDSYKHKVKPTVQLSIAETESLESNSASTVNAESLEQVGNTHTRKSNGKYEEIEVTTSRLDEKSLKDEYEEEHKEITHAIDPEAGKGILTESPSKKSKDDLPENDADAENTDTAVKPITITSEYLEHDKLPSITEAEAESEEVMLDGGYVNDAYLLDEEVVEKDEVYLSSDSSDSFEKQNEDKTIAERSDECLPIQSDDDKHNSEASVNPVVKIPHVVTDLEVNEAKDASDNPGVNEREILSDEEGIDQVNELSSSLHGEENVESGDKKASESRRASTSVSSTASLTPKHRPSTASSWSVYSNTGGMLLSPLDISGTIEFSLRYSHQDGRLCVIIKGCSDLAAVNKKKLSNPYVKTYLLPDKNSKRKTKAKKKTLNPVYNQTLKYDVTESELNTRTLNVAVWHDSLTVKIFLGEVNIDMAGFDGSKKDEMQSYQLHGKDDLSFDAFSRYTGELDVALRLTTDRGDESSPDIGQLEIVAKKLKNPTYAKQSSSPVVFIKCYFYPDKGRVTKQKSPPIKGKYSRDFDHLFTYTNVRLNELDERCVEITVWQVEKLGSDHFLGGLRFGSGTGLSYNEAVDWMDSTPEEVALWKKMKTFSGNWIDGQIPLRMLDLGK